MNAASYALRGGGAAAFVAALACGRMTANAHDVRPPTVDAMAVRSHARDGNGAKSVTLRDLSAEFSFDPTTLAVESRGVSLATPLDATTVTELAVFPNRLTFHLPERGLTVDASIHQARLTVRITSTRAQTIAWPGASSRDVRALALPIAEGLSISPADVFWQQRVTSGECRTAHGGLSMPFFGLDRPTSSFAVIFASDIGTRVCGEVADGLLTPIARHDFQKAGSNATAFEPYEVVFAPADGTPIGSALAYRAWLKSNGEFVSLTDKTRALPRVERLAGAIHAYLWGDGGTRAAIDDLGRLGVDRALLAFDDDRRLVTSEVVRYAESRGYLMARYDVFDSVMAPASADSPVAVFDDNLFRTGGVLSRDGKRLAGFAGRGLQLSSEALRRAQTPFVGQRIAAAKALGASAYFVDGDAFGDLLEDSDPAHPMTLARDRENRMARMRAVADAGFVLGSESAVAWSTPVVLFSHGNETIATDTYWKLLDDRARMGGWSPSERPGIHFKEIALTDEERRELLDPAVRVPLFQAVFHDSVVTTDRWEMPLMKAPSVVVPRTLLALLYGVPTIWNLDRKALREHGPRLAALARFFAPLHRRIVTLPLEEFAYLSPDRQVQRVRFGDKLEVTANFADEERAGVGGGCVEVRTRDVERATFCPDDAARRSTRRHDHPAARAPSRSR
ncbi:MAG TPA: glycoside hydrolase [Labilithrix sp.]|nr:glycoside hydrolase [Labilithrix sp.]